MRKFSADRNPLSSVSISSPRSLLSLRVCLSFSSLRSLATMTAAAAQQLNRCFQSSASHAIYLFILLWKSYKLYTQRKEEEEKQTKNKQTNKRTNLRHTQCVNNEIHIGGRQDRHISKFTLDKQKVINYARWSTIPVVGRRYTISHIFHVNTNVNTLIRMHPPSKRRCTTLLNLYTVIPANRGIS